MRVGRCVTTAAVVGLMMGAGSSLAKEPLLIVQLNQQADVSEVMRQETSFKQEALEMPLDLPNLRVVSAESLIFTEELGGPGEEVAWCRKCGGSWCFMEDDLRYLIDDTGAVMAIQHREAGNWVEVRDEDMVEEEMPLAEEIQSLKSHTIAILEDEDGNRFGMILSGVVVPDSARDASYGPSLWLDPEVFEASE